MKKSKPQKNQRKVYFYNLGIGKDFLTKSQNSGFTKRKDGEIYISKYKSVYYPKNPVTNKKKKIRDRLRENICHMQ